MNRQFRLGGVIITGAFALACSLIPSGPTRSGVVGIDLTPARLSLLPSQAADLILAVALSGRDSGGALATLQWSTTGGVITNNYMLDGVRHITYQAPAPVGDYLFIVTTTYGVPADTARIAVRATPVPVNAVTLTPATVTLVAGNTTTLRAVLTDSTGSALFGRPIEWTSTDAGVATVLVTGFVRAIGAGTATITATSEGHSGTAVVTVLPAPTP